MTVDELRKTGRYISCKHCGMIIEPGDDLWIDSDDRVFCSQKCFLETHARHMVCGDDYSELPEGYSGYFYNYEYVLEYFFHKLSGGRLKEKL